MLFRSLAIDPNAAPGATVWSISGQFRVIGEPVAPVPLPAGVWLLGSTLTLLASRELRAR